MERQIRDAEENEPTSMKVQDDGKLGVWRKKTRPVDAEKGVVGGVEGHVFGKSHSGVGGGGGFISSGYRGKWATASERAIWVRDEAEGLISVHGRWWWHRVCHGCLSGKRYAVKKMYKEGVWLGSCIGY